MTDFQGELFMCRQLATALLLGVSSILSFSGKAQQPQAIARAQDVGQAELTALSWRHHPSYQVFAFRAAQPAITPADPQTIVVNRKVRFALGQQLAEEDQKLIARELGVPVRVLCAFLKRLGKSDHIVAEHAAEQLRTVTIDYKYLNEQWNRYHPSSDQEKVKAGALQALETGDIAKAWLMFDALPRPKPPGGLRLTSPQ